MASERAAKPLDVGNGVVCASFGLGGGWLSVGTVHPAHGFVELSGMPPFDEAWRGDPSATRRYRGWMTEDRFAFLAFEPPFGPMRADPADALRPAWHAASGVAASAWAIPGTRTIVQRWRLDDAPVRVHFAGNLDLPALAEITEVNPPPSVAGSTRLAVDGRRLLVLAPHLPAAAVIEASAGTWAIEGDGASLEVASPDLTLRCSVAPTRDPPPLSEPHAVNPQGVVEPQGAADLSIDLQRIVRRALAYVRSCTALELVAGERAIITDHRLLPLSWTRDAYFQALLLLGTGEPEDVSRVADHLRWLWTRCERPDGHWVRSHYPDGRRKDAAFQADQQLYPLVELADFWRVTDSLPAGVDWARVVPVAWRASLGEIDRSTGLIASAETAADDPAAAPFIAAAQILLWYAASRLAELADAGAVALDAGELRGLAAEVRSSVDRHLVVDGPFGRQWAYATDAAGSHVRYHDANDLPTALAPAWGFCSADDPAWRATMQFAFSTHNPGFFDGTHPGLGSLHTPASWALGDVQAWLFGRLTDDRPSADAALARLEAIAFVDGMLPEAYMAYDPSRPIRHWFAWPGAVLAALLFLDRQGEPATRLRA